MLFGGTFLFVISACSFCYKREMADSQRGEWRIDVVKSGRELNAVANNLADSERIAALNKSKAGHLGE